MSRFARSTALLGAALACLPLAIAGAAATRDPFLVPVSQQATGFGPFREGGPQSSRAALRAAFGSATGIVRDSKDQCTLRWKAVGVVAHLTSYGQPMANVCTQGYFVNARLSDRRWHTSAGIRPGSTERAAQRVSKRSCGDACEFPGYVPGPAPQRLRRGTGPERHRAGPRRQGRRAARAHARLRVAGRGGELAPRRCVSLWSRRPPNRTDGASAARDSGRTHGRW